MELVRENFLNEDEHESTPLNDLLFQLYRGVKVLNINWSIEENNKYDLNEPSIDVLVVHEQDGGSHFFVRQCVQSLDDITQQKTSICCGYLHYKLFNDNDTNVQQDKLPLPGAKFYVDSDIAEQNKQSKMSIF